MIQFIFDEKGIHKYEQHTGEKIVEQLEYSRGQGYGFIRGAGIFPKREQRVDAIEKRVDGFWIRETDETISWVHENHYNYGGMTFRVQLKPGTYKVQVTACSKVSETNIAMGGMIGGQLLANGPWDAAGRVKRMESATWKENVWEYTYVLGEQYLDIEIEPKLETKEKSIDVDIKVGVSQIKIWPIENGHLNSNEEKVTIHLLGDSTVKSYVYEEAPMNGWGQLIGAYFDSDKASVVNYSQGGRSLKTMYQEGRLNDLLLHGKPGDYILIQSGHNDESRGGIKGIDSRFGRGNAEETFKMWLEKYFIPAIKVRGMKPIFVTCMTRLDHGYYSNYEIEDFDKVPICFGGFKYAGEEGINFPMLMKNIGEQYGIDVIDLYQMSLEYISSIGGEAAKAMFLSLEAGETPGKTNTGSYANGNPSGECDCTHYKACLGKQFVRMILTDMVKQKLEIAQYLKKNILEVIETQDDTYIEKEIFWEIPQDMKSGKKAYYRNQVEKLVEIGVLKLDKDRNFHPKAIMNIAEYKEALEKIWHISLVNKEVIELLQKPTLTVEVMGRLIFEAYKQKFGVDVDVDGKWHKPKYMTDYNGVNLSPDDPNYDSNLIGESAQYYALVPWEQLEDLSEIGDDSKEALQVVYELGLIRSEKGLLRGKMMSGTCLEPKREVSREKAAKNLYFLWVLAQEIKQES